MSGLVLPNGILKFPWFHLYKKGWKSQNIGAYEHIYQLTAQNYAFMYLQSVLVAVSFFITNTLCKYGKNGDKLLYCVSCVWIALSIIISTFFCIVCFYSSKIICGRQYFLFVCLNGPLPLEEEKWVSLRGFSLTSR